MPLLPLILTRSTLVMAMPLFDTPNTFATAGTNEFSKRVFQLPARLPMPLTVCVTTMTLLPTTGSLKSMLSMAPYEKSVSAGSSTSTAVSTLPTCISTLASYLSTFFWYFSTAASISVNFASISSALSCISIVFVSTPRDAASVLLPSFVEM